MYSIDCLKYVLFEDEINNVLSMFDIVDQDENFLAVKDYFEERLVQLKKNLEENKYD